MVYEWIVVGGGIQGCTFAANLLKENKVTTDQIRIIDPHETPLFRWRENTERIGMEFLRSPFVHHLDIEPFSQIKYAGNQHRKKNDFYGFYKRPSLNLFNEHSEQLCQELCLEACWHKGCVNGIERENGLWVVSTVTGENLTTKKIVLAISINEQIIVPDWADSFEDPGNQLIHIFDQTADFSRLAPPIAVIGGGITAAHLVIKLTALYPGKVHLIKRHPFRICDFDSDPGWLGPKNQKSFSMIKDYSERREVIKKARNRGSLTKELFLKLKKLEKDQLIQVTDGDVTSVKRGEAKDIILSTGNQEIKARSVVFATGFKPKRPGGSWLEKVIEKYGLPCAKCGYPIVSQGLEWCPHLYVMGPLAELEIGPIARNISGARQAAERIVQNVSYN
jgi:thioredoxin reductase